MIILNKELKGTILDIGGGGEGIIGQLYREQVTAIDNMQEELDEAPTGFEKVLMDATDLKYEDNSFDNVTFFYTLMYMQDAEQRRAIREATRVLKIGGEIHIWDCDIVLAYPDPFCTELDIRLLRRRITEIAFICAIRKNSRQILSNDRHRRSYYSLVSEYKRKYYENQLRHFVFCGKIKKMIVIQEIRYEHCLPRYFQGYSRGQMA